MEDKGSQYFSLGLSCQTAHQVRRIFNQERAGYFDWLITPTYSLVELLEKNFSSLDFPSFKAYYQGSRRDSVLEENSGIFFHHDFPRTNANGEVLSDFIIGQDNVLSKYNFLRERFENFCSSEGDKTFVLSNMQKNLAGYLRGKNFSEVFGLADELLVRLHTLLQFKCKGEVRLLCLRREPYEFSGSEKIIVLPNQKVANLWQGDDSDWDCAFRDHRKL